ncbi:MAG TPA: CDGSH iron-sulfur domain-containing protein, partial [Acidimicrobiia bacterium]|nr:CDGSH iron-sulfur domain-containing protein [Acidimicrobiia bacterium]
MSTEPEITVTGNGPYEVSVELPIVPKRIVRSPEGESIAWATAPQLDHPTPTWLCRCGHSENKPFCDGHHKIVGFDGTETASSEPFVDREKTHEGAALTVHRVGALCAKSRFCVNRITDWHQMLPDTNDPAVRTAVASMVEHCVSGALVLEMAGEIVEPDLPRAISPVEDGPYWVTGGVRIVRSDGVPLEVRNRVALCRCGASENKPFCDGSHHRIGFRAPTPPPAASAETPPPTAPSGVPAYRRIMVGVHEATSPSTYRTAATVARAARSEVSLVHAAAPGPWADRVLTEARARAAAAGLPENMLSESIEAGDPSDALRAAARRIDTGLIVLGRGGDRLARLPAQVSHRSPCDVLVVGRERGDDPGPYRKILIATDG